MPVPAPKCLKLPYKQTMEDLPVGDFKVYEFLAKGVCWTEAEPTETLPEGIEWSRHFWWADIAAPFNHFRYYQGWIPAYGTAPSTWVWWKANSRAAQFSCSSRWDEDLNGTVVQMIIHSDGSRFLVPGGYRVSLRSGEGIEFEDPDAPDTSDPVRVSHFVTWLNARLKVIPVFTHFPSPRSL